MQSIIHGLLRNRSVAVSMTFLSVFLASEPAGSADRRNRIDASTIDCWSAGGDYLHTEKLFQ